MACPPQEIPTVLCPWRSSGSDGGFRAGESARVQAVRENQNGTADPVPTHPQVRRKARRAGFRAVSTVDMQRVRGVSGTLSPVDASRLRRHCTTTRPATVRLVGRTGFSSRIVGLFKVVGARPLALQRVIGSGPATFAEPLLSHAHDSVPRLRPATNSENRL